MKMEKQELLMDATVYRENLRDRLRQARVNCDPSIGVERCPYCGQFHLVPGYCQALDPGSDWHRNPESQRLAAKYGAKPPTVTESVTEPETVTESVTEPETVTESVTPVTDRCCTVCGGPMPEGSRSHARYCSGACRMKAHRGREVEDA